MMMFRIALEMKKIEMISIVERVRQRTNERYAINSTKV